LEIEDICFFRNEAKDRKYCHYFLRNPLSESKRRFSSRRKERRKILSPNSHCICRPRENHLI